MDTLVDIHRLPPGTLVGGRYVIDDFLASGGFATVYRAHHHEIGRPVAIKVLEAPTRKTDLEGFQGRFLQEAQIAARIDHPAVVNVFDFGVVGDGRTYIAMDLLDGHDLELEIERKPLAAARAVPLFAECLGALAVGHAQGIVHKDLKPSNLFLVKPGTPHERLVILDFGIARSFESTDAKVTQEGSFTGTPAYLAPEYIREQLVTPAVDVYQMGLILIETLTGVPAIQSNTSMGFLLAHCLEEPKLPKDLLDSDLGRICLKAVQKDPEARFAHAGEFREALLGLERDSLRTTAEFPTDPAGGNATFYESATTLQFLSLPEDVRRTIADATAAPNSGPAEEEEKSKVPTIWLGFLAVFLVGVVGVVGLASLSEPEPAAAPTLPPELVAVAEEPTEPAVVQPNVVVADQPDIGRDEDTADTGPDLGEIARPEVVEPPEVAAPVRVKPRPKPKPKPKPVTKKVPRVTAKPKATDAVEPPPAEEKPVKTASPMTLSP